MQLLPWRGLPSCEIEVSPRVFTVATQARSCWRVVPVHVYLTVAVPES